MGKRRWALFAILFLVAHPASAHVTSGIKGRVTDVSGSSLPGVTVESSAPASGAARVTTSGSDGSYRLEKLPPGTYRVTFRLGDLAADSRDGVVVGVEQETTLNVVLKLSRKASVEVTARRTLKDLAAVGEYAENLVGVADSATEGTVSEKQLEERPVSRPAELLESVPGVIVSQHSGEGKANQYYLRGFNLDHGTDLFSDVMGVPVNMPTHAHGQGYSDLNFLIPELVSGIQYRKGPYYAEEGDFSAAGAVHVNYVRTVEQGLAQVEAGSFGYSRVLAAQSFHLGSGDLLVGGEYYRNNGPWALPDDYNKVNGLLSYSVGTSRNGFRITAMAYSGKWNSTDQVPQRAIDSGLISRWGYIDPTDGGETHRYSLSGEWQRSDETGATRASAYVMAYGLNIFNDFTYYLDDPVHGDQFEQQDRRVVSGGKVSRQWLGELLGLQMENSAGIQVRNDNITGLGLFHTMAQERLSTVRTDHVVQTSGSLYLQNSTTWTPFFRSVVGLRGDQYRFKVDSDNPLNSGTASAGLLSPKVTLVFGPWSKTEVYLNGGYGFHSNDARGATITVSPTTGETVEKVSPLARAKGAELGVRTAVVPHLEVTAALWGLDIASELIFSGDAGETEAARASRRYGVELAAVYSPLPGLTIDADACFSRAHFTEYDPVGDLIPGSLQNVLAAGVNYESPSGFFGGLRLRYFGPRPLVEDGSVWSKASTLLNAKLGYQIDRRWRLAIDILNVTNAKVADIDYYYASRLPGEPADGVNDVHTHPAEPFSIRLGLTARF